MLVTSSFQSQNPVIYPISKNNLDGYEIYSLFYDEPSSLIYAGTNQGLFVLKQNKFSKLKESPVTRGNSYFDIKKGGDGKIYCTNFKGQFFSVDKGELQLVIDLGGTSRLSNFVPNEDGSFVFYAQNKLLYQLSNGKKDSVLLDPDDYWMSLFRVNDSLYYGKISNRELAQLSITQDGLKLSIIKSNQGNNSLSFFYPLGDSLYLSSYENNETKLLNTHSFTTQSISDGLNEAVLKWSKDTLLGISDSKGFRWIYNDSYTIKTTNYLLTDLFISAVTRINNNTLAIGTFDRGVLLVNLNVKSTPLKGELLTNIESLGDNEYAISSRLGEVKTFKNDTLIKSEKSHNHVDHLFVAKSRIGHFFADENGLVYDGSIEQVGEFSALKVFIEHNDTTALYSNYVRLKKATISENLIHYEEIKDAKIQAMCSKSKEWIVVSESSSTYQLNTNTLAEKSILMNNQNFCSNSLVFDQETLYCGTQNNGVLLFVDDQLTQVIDQSNGLADNTVNKLLIDDNYLYILSFSGMQVYDLVKKKMYEVGEVEGITNENNVHDFALSDNYLWLLCSGEVLKIRKNTLFNVAEVNTLYVDSILVNGNSTSIEGATLETGDNNLLLYFDYRDVITKSEAVIHYQLIGYNSKWHQLSALENKIEFESLPPGEYRLKIKASYRGQFSEELEYSFSIRYPYYQRWWFYLFIGISGIIIVTLVSIWRIKQIRKKSFLQLNQEKLERQQLELNLKILRAQMNPHFIFNSINSIQDLILQEETIRSYDSLVVFSKLVRTILEFSEKEFITVKQETDFLKIYLELEKLRFKDDFDYCINSENCSPSTLLPSLIVQPFVENALKHGLLHKDGHKQLTIDFEQVEDTLICTIVDNGIGLEASKALKERQSKRHQSFSTVAIIKRIELLNERFNQQATYKFETLYNDQKNVIGSKVELKFFKVEFTL